MTLCFRAKGEPDEKTIPEWLSVEFSLDTRESRFYSVWVVPWIAEPAIALKTLELDGSVEAWIAHLESLGFEDVVQVSCVEFLDPELTEIGRAEKKRLGSKIVCYVPTP